jgi:DNA-binding MarR family transcriptional regulator
VNDDVARELEQALDRFMLRRNRDALCNPVIAVAPAGVDRQTYPLLTTLARLGPLSAARLAEEVGIDRSGASRYADRLQAAGLLDRGPDPRDRRSVLLQLTPSGTAAARHLREVLARHLQQLIRSWPTGQAQALIEGIDLLIGAPVEVPVAAAAARQLVS